MMLMARRTDSCRLSLLVASLLMMMAAVSGCAPTRNPVPEGLADEAQVIGFPDVRTWGGYHSELFQDDLAESIRQSLRANPDRHIDSDDSAALLSISGGGANGAFGTGVLCGWSERGDRPEFKLVTGISTGALIAPGAFLGSEYDQQITDIYTTVSTKDIYTRRGTLGALLGSDAMLDTTPLARLIEKHLTDEVVNAVAVEHERGRRLYIGTADIDTLRLVVWNMGAIAVHRTPEARDLFRTVMLASASIPVAFPPQRIPVEAGGEVYDEMHVDGGVETQAFLFGMMFRLDDVIAEFPDVEVPTIRLYVIRNSRFRSTHKSTEPRVLSIAGRAVGGMISSIGIGDMYRMYVLAKADGLDFNMVSIPEDYESQAKEAFDPEEMKRLFEIGRQLVLDGDPWQKIPPGMSERE